MLAPLVDPDTGDTILYDIFIEGKWIGSRRTIPQCIEALRFRGWPSAVLATNYKIVHGVDAHRIVFTDVEK